MTFKDYGVCALSFKLCYHNYLRRRCGAAAARRTEDKEKATEGSAASGSLCPALLPSIDGARHD